MGAEATSSAIYCFLERYIAPAAQQLKASDCPDCRRKPPQGRKDDEGTGGGASGGITSGPTVKVGA